MKRNVVVLTLWMAGLFTACSPGKEKTKHNKEEFVPVEEAPAPAKEKPNPVSLRNTTSFHTIEIKQMKFVPELLRLHAGDTVLWMNEDITDHDITEETKKLWTSSKLATGKSWSKVIHDSTDYYCSIHVVMKGKLIVEPPRK